VSCSNICASLQEALDHKLFDDDQEDLEDPGAKRARLANIFGDSDDED
jgi:hypothetical protein